MKLKVGANEKTISVKTARDLATAASNTLLDTKIYDIGTSAEHTALIAALNKQSRPYVVAVISPK